ncbi:hypothetical protein M9978_03715 [Sphingomonas sp. MG17]|uniref:Tetratricopeptide repeat-containing protein n=2 Tax=Sphingomonas tagetis TaxID=2949092 RepID=A0A9X2HEB8_9SPHN|nr:hypothetical protein [Sphingomonas tagetis]
MPLAALVLALALPAQASGTGDLPIITAAIRSGRLIQAELMLSRLPMPADAVEAEAMDGVRGEFALASGATEQALGIFSRLRGVDPVRCDYQRDFGIAAARLGDGRALDALRGAAASCATWQSSQLLGVVLAQRKDWGGSEDAFAQSLRLDPGNAVTLNNRAFARIEQGRYADALDDLRLALRTAPGDRRIGSNIDLAEGALGNPPRRRPGVDDDRGWALRLTVAAKGALRTGRTELAATLLTQAVEVDPRYGREASTLLDTLRAARGGMR